MKRLITILVLAIVCDAQAPSTGTGIGTIYTYSGSHGIVFQPPPHQPQLEIGGDAIIDIKDEHGKLMIHIDRYGKSTLGDGYHPDAGAKAFWEALAKYYPAVCVPPDKVRAKEVHK